jgi:hypothetical protein
MYVEEFVDFFLLGEIARLRTNGTPKVVVNGLFGDIKGAISYYYFEDFLV